MMAGKGIEHPAEIDGGVAKAKPGEIEQFRGPQSGVTTRPAHGAEGHEGEEQRKGQRADGESSSGRALRPA